MARHDFDIGEGGTRHSDEVGDDFEAARVQAQAQAQALLPDIVRGRLPGADLYVVTCDVRDESGRVVYRGVPTYSGTRFPT